MKTIIYIHPWEGSLNHAVLDKTKEILSKKKETYQVIDLYQEQFDPVFHASELKHFSKGETPSQQVKNYQNMLKNSTELIFIFPIWWYSTPAILKGFLDKVLLKNFAYTEDSKGIMTGLLTHIKKVHVITTGQAPKWYIKLLKGNSIQRTFISATLKSVGMSGIKWHHMGYVVTSSKEKKQQFLIGLESKL